MIKYRLACAKEHEFEAWFSDSAAFDRQKKRGQVVCPQCGSKKVSKTLMAPSVSTSKRRERAARQGFQKAVEHAAAAAEADAPKTPPATEADVRREAVRQEFLRVVRRVRKHVEDNAEYVGPKFAEEARRIHNEEAEERGIYGEATLDEARELLEDGIEVMPLPALPEDAN